MTAPAGAAASRAPWSVLRSASQSWSLAEAVCLAVRPSACPVCVETHGLLLVLLTTESGRSELAPVCVLVIESTKGRME